MAAHPNRARWNRRCSGEPVRPARESCAFRPRPVDFLSLRSRAPKIFRVATFVGIPRGAMRASAPRQDGACGEEARDRESVVEGRSVSVRVDLVVRRVNNKITLSSSLYKHMEMQY